MPIGTLYPPARVHGQEAREAPVLALSEHVFYFCRPVRYSQALQQRKIDLSMGASQDYKHQMLTRPSGGDLLMRPG